MVDVREGLAEDRRQKFVMFRDRHEWRTEGEKDGLAVKSWQRKEKEEKSSVDVCNHYRDKTNAKLPIMLQQQTERMCESVR